MSRNRHGKVGFQSQRPIREGVREETGRDEERSVSDMIKVLFKWFFWKTKYSPGIRERKERHIMKWLLSGLGWLSISRVPLLEGRRETLYSHVKVEEVG